MNIKEYIKLCAVKRGNIPMSKIAELIGTTPQNLGAKLRKNRLRVDELEKIANALDADLKVSFIDNATNEPII